MKKLLLTFFLVPLTIFAMAQGTVSGQVIDPDGSGIPGVNVVEKGTTNGTATDFDGNYTLNVGANATLVFSFIGYQTQEVAVGSRSTVNITMALDITELSEIVVIGYGEVEKDDATGAISSVTSEEFNSGVIASPEQLFQGKAAGVQITTNSGEPGGALNIRIRGTSSIRSGNNPLFVVDGVPLGGGETSAGGNSAFGSSTAKNPLTFLNPNDIASIDILKDASATAIYGSRGANGVIIITTKSGKSGQSQLDYSYNLGIANVANRYDLLSADEFVTGWQQYNPSGDPNTINFGANTDWQDELFRTAYTSTHNLSFGGGSELGNYRASISLQDQEGTVKESAMQRITARFNGNRNFLDDRLKIATQMTISDIHDDNVPIADNPGFEGDLIGAAIKLNPTIPVYNSASVNDGSGDPDGSPFQLSNTEPNPIAMLEYTDMFTNTLRFLGNINASYEIVDGLTINTLYGIDRSSATRKDLFSNNLNFQQIRPDGSFLGGRYFAYYNDITNTTWESYVNYNTDAGDINIDATVGYSLLSFENTFNGWQVAGFRTSDLNTMLNNISSYDFANGGATPTNSSYTKDEIQSFFARGVVNISDKYIITATIRADGSTRFGPDNAYGIFPSGALKWRLGSEDFMPSSLEDVALRVGWGVTGNQEFGHNLYTRRQRYGDYGLNNGGSIDSAPGLADVAFANPALQWETTSQFNVGVDFGLLEGKLSGSLDYYTKVTKDLLFQTFAAQPAPQPFVWENLDAEVVNSGLEIALDYVAVDNTDLNWDINGNVSFNSNIVNAGPSVLYNTGAINGQGLTGAFAQRIADGQPLYAYFLREFAGFSPDGSTQEYVGGDVQKFVGKSPLPTVNAGLTNTLGYKDFTLQVFFAGQFGHWIYSNTGNAFFTAGSIAGGRNVTKDVLTNGEASTNAPDVSTRFLEKGDFVRLQNLVLGYNVPINSDKINSLRISLTGQNLAVFTSYSGQDPEVNVNKSIDGIPSFGIDYTTYPRARTWVLGLNVGF